MISVSIEQMLRERKPAPLHRRALPCKRRGDLQSDARQRILACVAQRNPCASGQLRGRRHDADVEVVARDTNSRAVCVSKLRRRVSRSLFPSFGRGCLLLIRGRSIAVALVQHLAVRRCGFWCLRSGCRSLRLRRGRGALCRKLRNENEPRTREALRQTRDDETDSRS